MLAFLLGSGNARGETAVFTTDPELVLESGAGEGPVWHPRLGLLTSGDGNINRLDVNGRATIFRNNAGSNGLLFDRSGRLIVCESRERRVTRTNDDGSISVLADSYNGSRFNQPNDLTIDSQNRIYFSDPQYGDRSGMEMRDSNGKFVEGVYRIDPDGTVTRIITHEVDRPNGLIITPDDRYLFVADNNNGPNGSRKLWRFEMGPDGTVNSSSRKLMHDWGTTRGPDGMKLDQAGRLYVAAGLNRPHLPQETAKQPTAGVYVFDPGGKLLTFAPIPRDETTNCAFGGKDGKTLFVTAGGSLWKIRTSSPGLLVK
ncbi:SMP-30/gluconolactonase/LRE family protein [bacterium]|nr:SMP-30/gluconolactonase/LRE family protein [bacterium]